MSTVRIASAQPVRNLVDHKITTPEAALAGVDQVLDYLETVAHQAGKASCDIVAFPEDSLGLGKLRSSDPGLVGRILPRAVKRMLERLGAVAAMYNMYLICCNDTVEADGKERNTSILLGRDGREIGRYHKVGMPFFEAVKATGTGFPVFSTKDLGKVGMLICYDMVFPEGARCLTLGGADIIFHSTLGGAAIGDEDDISIAAFRTRAVENHVYIVVSWYGRRSMIISPKGKIIADGKAGGELVIADIDPFSGRDGGDSGNQQEDMRARLFRERRPSAYAILSDPNPPILSQLPPLMSAEEGDRIFRAMLTTGEEEFAQAEKLAKAGKKAEAKRAFEKLMADYPQTWIDFAARKRLAEV